MADIMEMEEGMKFAKRGEVYFAFAQASKPEECKLVFSKKRKADALGKQLRRDGGGSKIAYGTAKIEQNTLKLKCEESKVPDLKRVAKNMLSAKKSPVKKVVIEEEEEVQA